MFNVHLAALQKQEGPQGQIDLYYLMKLALRFWITTIPMPWQEPKSVIELPASRYGSDQCGSVYESPQHDLAYL